VGPLLLLSDCARTKKFLFFLSRSQVFCDWTIIPPFSNQSEAAFFLSGPRWRMIWFFFTTSSGRRVIPFFFMGSWPSRILFPLVRHTMAIT